MSKIVLTKTSLPSTPGVNQVAVYVTTGGDFAKIDENGITTTLGAEGPTGDIGPAGQNGATWHIGSGVPSGGTGVDGDLYLNTLTGDYYVKTGSSWNSPVGTLVGPSGQDGATWLSGSGVPSSGTGNDNDHYLNTSTGDVYKKTSGVWNVVVNLTGPAGTNGTNGQGVQPGGTTGQVLVKNSSTDYDTSWSNPPIAINAVRYFSAVVAPTATDDSSNSYRVGDIWIDSAAENAYICIKDTADEALWKQITIAV
jgi:hypothetical protein